MASLRSTRGHCFCLSILDHSAWDTGFASTFLNSISLQKLATNSGGMKWINKIFCLKDTLKSPPPENKTMKKASMISIFITTFFYLCCGCFGYAAFGNDTPGNLLTGFGFFEPYWLIDLANACVVLHLVGGYQVLIFFPSQNNSKITFATFLRISFFCYKKINYYFFV